jgi:hypothetical protein
MTTQFHRTLSTLPLAPVLHHIQGDIQVSMYRVYCAEVDGKKPKGLLDEGIWT